MYIRKLAIRNFRRIGQVGLDIVFNNGINIVLGENNVGKSTVIDAMRLALMAGQYKKSIYVTPDDFHVDKYGMRADKINIDIYFEGLVKEQGKAFYLLTDGTDTTKAELHLQYILHKDAKGIDKVREYVTGGIAKNALPKETFDNINILYLPALRNAESDLKPSRGSQLANILFSVAANDTERQRVLEAFIAANEKVKSDPSIKLVEQIINKNLGMIEKEELQQSVKVNLIEPTFEAIASSLDVGYQIEHTYISMISKEFISLLKKLGIKRESIKGKGIVKKIDEENSEINLSILNNFTELNLLYLEIIKSARTSRIAVKQNGLGYNNILSMAASLGDLQKKPIEEEISVLLVEEPEAHLHPQLLELLFNFFKKSDSESKIQIIMTSHSPSLVSKSDIDSINILYQLSNHTKSTSLKEIGLSPTQKNDLKRYLDVTKSQLFFAKRVLFVEGISEAILLNEFAKLFEKPFDKYSVEIVNINGVAFEPFALLFAANDQNSNIDIPCAIISDNDKCTNNDDPYQIKKAELVYSKLDVGSLLQKLKNGTMSYRATNLLDFNKSNISIHLAEKTLEFELASIKENNEILLYVLKTQHPDIAKDIEQRIKEGASQEDIAIRMWVAISDCKGAFAQILAEKISKIISGEEKVMQFSIPPYIQKAINHLIP